MPKKVHAVNIKLIKRAREPAEKTTYHHGNLRTALVAAGLLFLASSERGEFSLRELARQVGVSANAAYRHFADKEALLVALAAEGFRRLDASQIEAAKQSPNAHDGLLAAGRAYIGFARDNPALFRLMFGRFAQAHYNGELAEASQSSFHTLLAQMARAAKKSTDDSLVMTGAVHAWGLVHGLSHLVLDGQFTNLVDDPDALLERVLSMQSLSSPKKRRDARSKKS